MSLSLMSLVIVGANQRACDAVVCRDQIVTLTTTCPHRRVRIVGITSDHGLLRTVPEGGYEYIDLQPDGNTFDLMAGLIMTKAG